MLRRRGGHRQVRLRQRVRLPPVELDDALGRHAPGLEVRAHAERGDEGHVALRQRADRRVVEVVVVIVRDHHRVERRQRADRDRHRLEALRAGPLRGRGALAPHRVGQHAQPVDLDQHRGMAEPGGAQAAARLLRPAGRGSIDGSGAVRHAPIAAEQEIADGRHRDVRAQQSRQHRMHVAERAVMPQRR